MPGRGHGENHLGRGQVLSHGQSPRKSVSKRPRIYDHDDSSDEAEEYKSHHEPAGSSFFSTFISSRCLF